MVKLYSLSVLFKAPNNGIWLKSAYDLSAFGFFQRTSVQEFMAFVSKTIVERTQTAARQSVKEGEYMCHVYVRPDNLAGVLISDHDYPHRVAHTLITKSNPMNCEPTYGVFPQDMWTRVSRRYCNQGLASIWFSSIEPTMRVFIYDSYVLTQSAQVQIQFAKRLPGKKVPGHTAKMNGQRWWPVSAPPFIKFVLDEFATTVPAAQWPVAVEATIIFPQVNTYLAKYQNPREADAMTKIQEELDETKIILHNTIEAVLQRGEKLDDLVAKSEGLSIQSKAFYKTARKTNSCCTFG